MAQLQLAQWPEQRSSSLARLARLSPRVFLEMVLTAHALPPGVFRLGATQLFLKHHTADQYIDQHR